MPISLQRIATTGETAYIAKHNANIEAVEAAINTMQGTVGALQTGAASPINAINVGRAMFGAATVALIGENSFAHSTAGTNLSLQPGFFWDAGTGQMFYKTNSTVIAFSGAAAGTYYIRMGADSIPYRDTASAGALYSVVWSGTTFTTVTKLATYAVGYDDLVALLNSDYSGLTYGTPDKRLEATEKAFSAVTSKTITTADVTLTTAEAMEAAVFKLTGAMTAARNLIVPAKKKVLFIDNDTTGGFAVTVKTAAGTGVAINMGDNAAVYCDGSNVYAIFNGAGGGGGGATTWTGLSDTPDGYSGQANKIVKVKADESGLEFGTSTAPTVFTGLTDAPASYTGQAGKVPVVNLAETGLEFGSPASAFPALSDTPDSYSGMGLRVVSVKADETGLEFTAAATPSSLLGLTDTPDSYATKNLYILRVNSAGNAVEFADPTSVIGPQNFLDLPDTPNTFTGEALKFLRVNAAGNAVEFAPAIATSFLGLTDTSDSYAGMAFRAVTVKGDETGLEFSSTATPTAFIGLTDAPASYTGHGGKAVKVKADASGLEFVTDEGGAGLTVKEEGTNVHAAATALDFVGDRVTATNPSGSNIQVKVRSPSHRGTWGVIGETITYNFESGVPAVFTPATAAGWTVDTKADSVIGTTNALRAATISHSQTTEFEIVWDMAGSPAHVKVRYFTDTESTYDTFKVFENGVEKASDSGTSTVFEVADFTTSNGSRTIKFRYSKDSSGTVGADTIWISQVQVDVVDTVNGYLMGDTVDFNGGRFLCLVDDTGAATTDTSAWQYLGPSSLTGNALKGVRVNSASDALEFYNEPVVVGGAWNGTIAANTVVLFFVAPYAIDFAAAIAGSAGMALTAATAQTDFDVKKVASGSLTETSVGTMRFAAAGTAPTFIAASAFSLAAGDALKVIAPGTADATLANISFSLAGTR